MPKTYSGGCQCGNVRYEVTLELGEVMSCNCSRCSKLGWLIAPAPAANFKLVSGENELTEFLFNKHAIHHLFCTTCGVQSFSRGKMPDGTMMVGVNARCLDGVDVNSLKVKQFDGRSL